MANVITDLIPAFSFDVSFIIYFFGFIALGFLLAAGGFFGFKYMKDKKNFNTIVRIYYQPKGSKAPILLHDMGGVFFKSKVNLKRFWLKKHKIGLNPDNIPFITDNKGNRIVTLWQRGMSSFRFVVIGVSDNPGVHYVPGEEDVNWAIAAWHEYKDFIPDTKGFLEKYGWMVMWTLTIGITLLMMIFLFQKFEVLSGLMSSANAVAENLKQTAMLTQPIVR